MFPSSTVREKVLLFFFDFVLDPPRPRPGTGPGPYGVPPYTFHRHTDRRMEDILLVIRYTRRWLQYGIILHAVVCIVIAAALQTLK